MTKVRIETDRSTGQWLVVEHNRRGWSVLKRCETSAEAHDHARRIVDMDRDFARECQL